MAQRWRLFVRNRMAILGLCFFGVLVVAALCAPLLIHFDPEMGSPVDRFKPPGYAGHLLGTDELGRDQLARLLYGARISLGVGLSSVFIGALIGVPLGLAAAWYGGWTDALIMRTADLLLAFPRIVLVIVTVSVIGRGVPQLIGTIGFWLIPVFARVISTSAKSLMHEDYVMAARSLGARDRRILLRHVLPNSLGPLVVTATVEIANAIMVEAGLSFLGLGIQPPIPSWGGMLAKAKTFLRLAPHLATYPGVIIAATVLSVNLMGDGLRDAFDPRRKR